jgi:hypothetical protein
MEIREKNNTLLLKPSKEDSKRFLESRESVHKANPTYSHKVQDDMAFLDAMDYQSSIFLNSDYRIISPYYYQIFNRGKAIGFMSVGANFTAIGFWNGGEYYKVDFRKLLAQSVRARLPEHRLIDHCEPVVGLFIATHVSENNNGDAISFGRIFAWTGRNSFLDELIAGKAISLKNISEIVPQELREKS